MQQTRKKNATRGGIFDSQILFHGKGMRTQAPIITLNGKALSRCTPPTDLILPHPPQRYGIN
jgi:hypothetical protein